LNPETGLPRSFMELELEEHLEIWRRAAPLVIAQSRYAAVLVSLHGTALYERRNLDRLGAADVERIRAFLDGQRALRERLLAGLRAEPATAAIAADEVVRRNQRLVWTWDSLSLGLLLGWAPFELRAVPAVGGEIDIEVADAALDPWPFGTPELTVRCEGRRLAGRFDDEHEMRAALVAAPWTTLDLTLTAP
jgi:hypothetical protein